MPVLAVGCVLYQCIVGDRACRGYACRYRYMYAAKVYILHFLSAVISSTYINIRLQVEVATMLMLSTHKHQQMTYQTL